MYTVEQIIAKLGIENLPPDQQDSILQSLSNSVATRILLNLSEQLSDEDMGKITDLMEADKEEEAEKLINERIPNYTDFKARIEADTIEDAEDLMWDQVEDVDWTNPIEIDNDIVDVEEIEHEKV